MDRAELDLLLARFFGSGACPVTVDAAYLFGSRARGEAQPDSDVDVAVLLAPGVPRGWPLAELKIQTALEALSPLSFDVISLADAPPDLVHRILRDGRVVHDADRARRIAFEIRARNEFWDIEPILERYRRPRSAA
jgi:predicted nucleotidyltransferase